MSNKHAIVLLIFVMVLGSALGRTKTSRTSIHSPIMNAFAGNWTCDNERTDEERLKAGDSQEEIERDKVIREKYPILSLSAQLLVFADDLAYSPNGLQCEYKFYHMHKHDKTLCGKAWFHEDRNDQGDMSACRVKLALVNDELHFQVRHMQRDIEVNEIVGFSESEFEADPAACDADSPKAGPWGDWMMTVYKRVK